MQKTTLMRIAITASFVAMIVMNYLAVTLPINGKSTGELSDMFPSLFTPAGYTFSIWSVIYLMLTAYVLYRWGVFQSSSHEEKRATEATLASIDGLFIINAVANVTWILAWHYMVVWLSVLIMAVLLVSLILLTRKLHARTLFVRDRAFILLPFSTYFGWITVATIANVSTLLVGWKWDGFGFAPESWTVLILLVGLAIGLATTLGDKSAAYGLVLAWAYAGILTKHLSPTGFDGAYLSIIVTASLCIGAFLMAVLSLGLKGNGEDKVVLQRAR